MTKQNKLEAIYTDAETNDLANNIHTRMNKRIDEIDAIKTDINLNSVESMKAIKSVRIDMMQEIDRTDQNAIARDDRLQKENKDMITTFNRVYESLNEENDNLKDEIESLKKQVQSLSDSNYENKQTSMQFKNSITEFLNTRKASDVMQVKQSICENLNMKALTILKVATNKKIDELIESAREQSIVNETAHIIEQYEYKAETE